MSESYQLLNCADFHSTKAESERISQSLPCQGLVDVVSIHACLRNELFGFS
jgi:hypothetical protein